MQPLISVLITAYNREKFIEEAIQSVLGSTYLNFELIIVDDGSTDGTVEKAQRLAKRDPRVRLYVNPKNLGDYPNRNKAAGYAGGVYLKYLDSDDILFPWTLQVMADCMERYPEAALGLSFNRLVNHVYPALIPSRDAYQLYFYRNSLLNIGPSGTIIRREAFERLGGFSHTQFVSDNELWLRLAKGAPVVAMPPNLVYWREHDAQQIRLENSLPVIEAIRFEMIKKILREADTPLNERDKESILANLTNIKCRRILLDILRGKVSGSVKRAKSLQLTAGDFANAILKRNNYSELTTSVKTFF